jgi:hypothetical protein
MQISKQECTEFYDLHVHVLCQLRDYGLKGCAYILNFTIFGE